MQHLSATNIAMYPIQSMEKQLAELGQVYLFFFIDILSANIAASSSWNPSCCVIEARDLNKRTSISNKSEEQRGKCRFNTGSVKLNIRLKLKKYGNCQKNAVGRRTSNVRNQLFHIATTWNFNQHTILSDEEAQTSAYYSRQAARMFFCRLQWLRCAL